MSVKEKMRNICHPLGSISDVLNSSKDGENVYQYIQERIYYRLMDIVSRVHLRILGRVTVIREEML